jgi:beta-lactamase regulating signal transducer with metallopeptidase domain
MTQAWFANLSEAALLTTFWTGALIALVLMLRRPVSRVFGARAAYALWLLPMLRLVMPPLVLPAWMAPSPSTQPILIGSFSDGATGFGSAALESAVVGATDSSLFTAVMLVWAAGVCLFLARRFALYHHMRSDLLREAYSVGDFGKVRLVETPAVSGPVAFGVIDKVVALPTGFMNSRNKSARDLALAHELAHHKGGDLLANLLVQPLFALHWFNPLGWIGWKALRCDQEAACDARVLASRSKEERVAYAGIIAELAIDPNGQMRAALAAPMACPVLGDKSIIHRLKRLPMAPMSERRIWAGRGFLLSAALVVPLTASISYAEHSREVAVPPSAPGIASKAESKQVSSPHPDKQSFAAVSKVQARVHTASKEQSRVAHEPRPKQAPQAPNAQQRDEESLSGEQDARSQSAEGPEMRSRVIVRHSVSIDKDGQFSRTTIVERRIGLSRSHRAVLDPSTPSGGHCADQRVDGLDCLAAAQVASHKSLMMAGKRIARDRDLTAAQKEEALRTIGQSLEELNSLRPDKVT